MENRAQKVSLIVLLSLVLAILPLRSELLVIKKTATGFAPLDESDAPYIAAIDAIFMRYQWPMSALHAFDSPKEKDKLFEEADNLFTPDQPYAEELFIQEKIREMTGNPNLYILFFPTTLYELFVLIKTFESSEPTPLRSAVVELMEKSQSEDPIEKIIPGFKLGKIISGSIQTDPPTTIQEQIKILTTKANALFFGDSKSAHHSINQALVEMLFTRYSDLATCSTTLEASSMIEQLSEDLIDYLTTTLNATSKKGNKIRGRFIGPINPPPSTDSNLPYDFTPRYLEPKAKYLIKKIVAFEYKARQANKALLLRGAQLKHFTWSAKERRLPLIGTTTIHRANSLTQITDRSYSVSFGNSLFAGYLRDYSACVFNFLTSTSDEKVAENICGYEILLNKKEYIESFNSNLFLISPLSTLVTPYESGEFFHSRTKIALKKSDLKEGVVGITLDNLTPKLDSESILFIEKNPLKQAAQFSSLIAESCEFLQVSEEGTSPTPEQKTFAQDILGAQNEAADYYQSLVE